MGPRYGSWTPPAYRVNTLSRCDETTEFRGQIRVQPGTPAAGELGRRAAED